MTITYDKRDLFTPDKKEVVRQIMRLHPEWQRGVESVRFDADGEVCYSRDKFHAACGTLGCVDGKAVIGWHNRAAKYPFFVTKRESGDEFTVIGHIFDRFEYEIFRAAILAEEGETT